MSQLFQGIYQNKSEIKTHTIDFTTLLPVGAAVASATAVHTPPGEGTAVTPTVTSSSPYVYVTIPAIDTMGVHYIDVLATIDDGDKYAARLTLYVVYPTSVARDGMAEVIRQLRLLADAGADEYLVANVVFWADEELQRVADRHVILARRAETTPYEEYVSGVLEWHDYDTGIRYWEAGTPTFRVETAAGSVLPSSGYTMDVLSGMIRFTNDTKGSAFYVTGRAYELNGAAADVWRYKAGHAAAKVTFRSDNHQVNLSDETKQYQEMAKYYDGLRPPIVVKVHRNDTWS